MSRPQRSKSSSIVPLAPAQRARHDAGKSIYVGRHKLWSPRGLLINVHRNVLGSSIESHCSARHVIIVLQWNPAGVNVGGIHEFKACVDTHQNRYPFRNVVGGR